jgi:hypothetical protein
MTIHSHDTNRSTTHCRQPIARETREVRAVLEKLPGTIAKDAHFVTTRMEPVLCRFDRRVTCEACRAVNRAWAERIIKELEA